MYEFALGAWLSQFVLLPPGRAATTGSYLCALDGQQSAAGTAGTSKLVPYNPSGITPLRIGWSVIGGSDCRKELGYFAKKSTLQCLKADAFVLISGGSLWDDGISKANAKTRFLRFILPARLYQLMGKPVYVLGVGGGPASARPLDFLMEN